MSAQVCVFTEGMLSFNARRGLVESLAFEATREATRALLQPQPAAGGHAELLGCGDPRNLASGGAPRVSRCEAAVKGLG